MSKREYMARQSYIDWLKSLGCIAYLPLGSNDFTEYISGNTAYTTGYGTYSWDSNAGMYLFTSPTIYPNSVLSVNIDYTKTTNKFTIMTKIKAGNKNSAGVGLFNSNTPLFIGGCDGKGSNNAMTSVQNNWANKNSSFHHAFVMNYDGNNNNFAVQDGQQYWTNTYDYINHFHIAIGQNINKINISQSYSNAQSSAYYNYNGSTSYYADILLFDNALELQTIRKIQGYE